MEFEQHVEIVDCAIPEYVAGFAVAYFLVDGSRISSPVTKDEIDQYWHLWRVRGNA